MRGLREPSPRAIASRIERELRAAANPARAIQEKRYLKSDLQFLSSGVPAIRAAAKVVRKRRPALRRTAMLELVRIQRTQDAGAHWSPYGPPTG